MSTKKAGTDGTFPTGNHTCGERAPTGKMRRIETRVGFKEWKTSCLSPSCNLALHEQKIGPEKNPALLKSMKQMLTE